MPDVELDVSTVCLQVLGHCIRGEWNAVEERLQVSNLSMQACLDCLVTQKLDGVLLTSLNRDQVDWMLTSEQRTELYENYQRYWLCNRLLMGKIAGLFERSSIIREHTLVMKGPLMVQQLYGDIAARPCADIDLLVDPSINAQLLHRDLIEEGYVPESSFAPIYLRFDFPGSGLAYSRDEFTIDLHTTTRSHPALRLDLRKLWEAQTRLNFEGQFFPALSLEDHLLFKCAEIVSELWRGVVSATSLLDVYLLAIDLSGEVAAEESVLQRAAPSAAQLPQKVIALAAYAFNDLQLTRKHSCCNALSQEKLRKIMRFRAEPDIRKGRRLMMEFLPNSRAVTIVWWLARRPLCWGYAIRKHRKK